MSREGPIYTSKAIRIFGNNQILEGSEKSSPCRSQLQSKYVLGKHIAMKKTTQGDGLSRHRGRSGCARSERCADLVKVQKSIEGLGTVSRKALLLAPWHIRRFLHKLCAWQKRKAPEARLASASFYGAVALHNLLGGLYTILKNARYYSVHIIIQRCENDNALVLELLIPRYLLPSAGPRALLRSEDDV